jgi:adenylate cyclase
MATARRLAAIMFTDLEGFTSLTQKDEAGALRLLEEQDALVGPIIAAHAGRKIKSIGDGLLVEFPNARDAIECAVDLQRSAHEHNSLDGAQPLRIRVGIHLGDVEQRGTDILGDAVNIASRIEPLAEAGGVCFSVQVFDQVRNKVPYQLEKLGPQSLKGLGEPIDVYRVVLPWIRKSASPTPPAPLRLAVLPLASISPNPKDEYFADGLTEELVSVLSQIRGLRVIARTSVAQYKSTSKSISQIGAELGVSSVLEGSVRTLGGRLRITLQLIDVATQGHLWASNYNRDLDDVFAVQADVAANTAEALRLELLGSEREALERRPFPNLEAYDLYLKGIHALKGGGSRATAESIRLFEAATAADPGFASAYAYQANALILLAGESVPASEAFPRAQKLVNRALELDHNCSDAHTARGNLALQFELDWERAEAEFTRAIALNPSGATAHFWYGILLLALQRFDEAKRQLRTSRELDPLWPLPEHWLLNAYQFSGEFTPAIASLEDECRKKPGAPGPHLRIAMIHALAGRMEEARKEASLVTGDLDELEEYQYAVLAGLIGNLEPASRLLAQWEQLPKTEYVSPTDIAGLYAVLGRKERALELLEREEQEGERSLWFSYQFPAFHSIRDEPRFVSLLLQSNLPARPRARDAGP